MALTEAMAHVELLHESGDLDVAEDGALRPTGSRNYLRSRGRLRQGQAGNVTVRTGARL